MNKEGTNPPNGKWYTLNCIKILSLFQNGVYSKRKEFAFRVNKSFNVDLFSEGPKRAGRKTGSGPSCLPCIKIGGNLSSVHSPLKNFTVPLGLSRSAYRITRHCVILPQAEKSPNSTKFMRQLILAFIILHMIKQPFSHVPTQLIHAVYEFNSGHEKVFRFSGTFLNSRCGFLFLLFPVGYIVGHFGAFGKIKWKTFIERYWNASFQSQTTITDRNLLIFFASKYLFVLRFYGPVNPMGSCRARSVYLTTRLLGRLSPLSG